MTPEQEQRIIDKLDYYFKVKGIAQQDFYSLKQSGALDEVISIYQEEIKSSIGKDGPLNMGLQKAIKIGEQLKTNNNE